MEQIVEFAGNHAVLSGAFVAVLLALLWAEVNRRSQGFVELGAAQATLMINRQDAVVVDVSPAADFNKGHILGARNVPMARFKHEDSELAKLAGRNVVVACKTGQTAQTAAAALVKAGAASVAVLKGGMVQWQADNYPVTRK